MYFVIINQFMMNMFNTLMVFQLERPVFLREQANKMYGVLPYFLAKNITDLPVLLLTPLLTALINYFTF